MDANLIDGMVVLSSDPELTAPMAVFAYKAANAGAAVVRGTIAADSPRQAREHRDHSPARQIPTTAGE